jgi:hypothetical protein
MALTYVWALKSLKKSDVDNLTGVIVQTTWTCTGTDEDGFDGVFNGATPFDPAQVDPNNYTEYEDLTEAQVLGWIEGVVVGSYKEHVDAQIMKQINAKKVPVVEVDEGQFPWSPPTEPVPPAPPEEVVSPAQPEEEVE